MIHLESPRKWGTQLVAENDSVNGKEGEEFNWCHEELLIAAYSSCADIEELWNGEKFTKYEDEFRHQLPTGVSEGVSHKSQHLQCKQIHKMKAERRKKNRQSAAARKREDISFCFG